MYLAINTALDPFSYSISDGNRLLIENKQLASREFSEQFIYHIETSLKSIGLSFDELKAVGVVSGPGSYTGLRLGITTAKTIALVQDVPIYQLTTLELMAKQCEKTDHIKCIVIPARKNEITVQLFSGQADASSISEPVSYNLESMANFLNEFDQELHIYGQCQASFIELFNESNVQYHQRSLSTEFLAKLASNYSIDEKHSDFNICKPFYFYEPVIGKAKAKAKRRK